MLDTGREPDAVATRENAPKLAANALPQRVADTKRIFDERRQRFQTLRTSTQRMRPLADAVR